MSLQQCYSPLHNNNDTIDDNDIILADVEEETLPLTTSLEQRYSSFYNNDFRNNDDHIDDIGNTEVNNIYMESYNNITDNYFNSSIYDRGVGHFDIPTNYEDEDQNNIPINNSSRPILSMAHSRRRTIADPFVSLVQFFLQTWLLKTWLEIVIIMILVWVSCLLRRMS